MHRLRRFLGLTCLLASLFSAGCDSFVSASGGAGSLGEAERYRQTRWSELMPADWTPGRSLRGLNLSLLKDADPQAQALLQKIRAELDAAPINPAMNGVTVRIRGYMAPLEKSGESVGEFLLVPFFGGCIHTPPPPANQIIHVFPARPLPYALTQGSVIIAGVIETVAAATALGHAGYRMRAASVDAYRPNR